MAGAPWLVEPGRGEADAGAARIAFQAAGGRTRLARLEQRAPLRALFPRVPAGELIEAVLVNTGGGVVGGDRLAVEVEAGADAQVRVTSQAAEKIYRSAGPTCALETRLIAGPEAWLEWLPQETILFDGARLRRSLRVEAADGARLLAADMVVFGRRARSESFRDGLFYDRWEVRVGSRLVWADALRLANRPGAVLSGPFSFAGAGAFATVIYIAPDAEDRVDLARDLAAWPDVRSGATCIGPVLVVRWLARDPAALRAALRRFSVGFRHAVAGLPERIPAIWRA
jgi:urease accessory protein